MRDFDPAKNQYIKVIPKQEFDSSLLETIYEYKLQDKLNPDMVSELTHKAIKEKNITVIEILAETYPRNVAEIIETYSQETELIIESNTLIFQIKDFVNFEFKQILLKKLVPRLLRHAERIYKSIDRSQYPEKIPYFPGRSWELVDTIMNFMISGDIHFTYKHVICKERKKRRKSVVLLIDKSHSVINHLKLIILTSILFGLSFDMRDLAIIGFDTNPKVIKGFKEFKMTNINLIDRLINIRSGGKTDISSALELAKNELSQQVSPKRTLIMISDLLATSGNDFLPLLQRMEDIRIILTPRRKTLQLTQPLLGKLRNLTNIKLFLMPSNDKLIPKMLEGVLFD